jgi:tRNA pseudouridine38-40 synthase
MPRYFLELSYHGANYAGFQIQENAHTVQEEVENALAKLLRKKITLTGSSRTDTGVHAHQNFFHFDNSDSLDSSILYNLNAILPGDIALKSIRRVTDEAHCRFDAISRSYIYRIYREKNPFLKDTAYFYPYKLDVNVLKEAAGMISEFGDFTSFSKRNTQVKTFNCKIIESFWDEGEGMLQYHVTANRFLRGMVRGLVGTMLRVGRGRAKISDFREVLQSRNNATAYFDVPGHGLVLSAIEYDWSSILIKE